MVVEPYSCLLSFTDSIPIRHGEFGEGNGSILLDNLRCTGDEESLLECDGGEIGVHDCSHSEDAGVRCQGITTTHCGFLTN